MENSKKYKWILSLMITTLVLLTLFVFQWLRSQYNTEEDRLVEELTSLYIDAQDEMVDTILFRNYVDPVLKPLSDSAALKNDQLQGVVKWEGSKKMVTVNVRQGFDSITHGPDTIRLRKTNDEMLLKSVKLIISHSSDSQGSDRQVVRDFRITPDTTEFKSRFISRLEQAGFEFSLDWNSGEHKAERALFLAPVNPFSLPSVSVMKYSGYLAAKILPEILFGLMLIFLTALAFFISYRNLRDHAILNSLRNEFISNMTHELKTPVSSISLALESLSKYNLRNDPEMMDEYMRLAISETKRLESLINRVLDHSMLEENIQTLTTFDNDLNVLISEVVSTMHPRIIDKGSISFTPSERRLTVKCDALLFKGVIINLVDNSIKYSGIAPKVEIFSSCRDRWAVITVNDNGPGIPVEYHGKVFEKFFRLPAGNVHNVKGYGLGLSFVSLVMKLHKGSIDIKNLEQGCSFILKLPLTDAEN